MNNANQRTVAAYDAAPERYESRAAPMETFVKDWIDVALGHIAADSAILEIGTGTGRDAEYIERKGFLVERTDASTGLLELMKQRGIIARRLDVLTDEIGNDYAMILAAAVIHHFPPDDFRYVLTKIHDALTAQGVFAFMTKEGRGEVWESDAIDQPRYFYFWECDTLRRELQAHGFETINIKGSQVASSGQRWITVIARVV